MKQKISPAMVIIVVVVAIVVVFGVMLFQGQRTKKVDLGQVQQMPEVMKMKMKIQGPGQPVTPQGGQ